jgi:thiol-disulfide isomerase/thioredoxin
MNPKQGIRCLTAKYVKLWRLSSALALMTLGPHVYGEEGPPVLPIGSPAPAFALQGVDGHLHKLSDYARSKVLVVAFLCNHCPESQLYEGRIERLARDYQDKGVALVAIQADHPESIPTEQLAYSDVGESLEDMKTRAAYRHFTFPYLYDGDTQKAARLYGPKVAPQVFIFDQARRLRYEGRVDDNTKESLARSLDARNAIDALLAGKPVEAAQTSPSGCAMKWADNPSLREAERAKMEAEPVSVVLAGADELTRLRSNPTGKLLLVNFYATWCGPCVSEFPELMATYRMYRERNFALTTVSSNEPAERPDVLKFLFKMHASSTNLLFGTTDTYALQAAFDPNLGAAVPFTVLIAPNGDILFQQQGDLDMLALRRAILANLPDDDAHPGAQEYWSAK